MTVLRKSIKTNESIMAIPDYANKRTITATQASPYTCTENGFVSCFVNGDAEFHINSTIEYNLTGSSTQQRVYMPVKKGDKVYFTRIHSTDSIYFYPLRKLN